MTDYVSEESFVKLGYNPADRQIEGLLNDVTLMSVQPLSLNCFLADLCRVTK